VRRFCVKGGLTTPKEALDRKAHFKALFQKQKQLAVLPSLEKVKPLGQDAVHIVGDLEKKVSRIALGTGAITSYRQMYDMDADVLLLTDDGTRLWESGQWALDMGIPLIIVNHSTSEEPGMMTLTKHIQQAFPKITVKHIPVGCIYHTSM